MDIRLIAVDMDGTLLNEENRITERTIEALRKMESCGALIVPATGRCRALLPKEIRQNLKIRYAILENGAEIWDYEKEEVFYEKGLSQETTEMIYHKIRNQAGFAEFFKDGEAYAEISGLGRLNQVYAEPNFVNYFKRDHIFVQNLEMRPDVLHRTKKINMYFLNPDLRKELEDMLRKEGNCEMTSSGFGNLEVQDRNVQKGAALKLLCEKNGILQKEVMAFGDGNNDIGMLQYAGIGIAMGNADEEIKKAADVVTLTNRKDGVAAYLEEFLKLKM